jgi:spermidine synthase
MQETVIYQNIGDDGEIEITQNEHHRSLYLGSDAKQSSMDLRHPERLILSYTRAMMSCLLFQPAPRRVLLLGLGGGSLARFILHHFPACVIDAVEIRRDVVKLAHGYFRLPEQPSLKVHIEDAQDFLDHKKPGAEQYDLILVDAFNHDGMADTIKTTRFFAACRDRISRSGIVTVNLWDHPSQDAQRIIGHMERNFDGNLLRLPVVDKGNLIVHAARDRNLLQLDRCRAMARQLETALGIEFVSLLRQLNQANRWRSLVRLIQMWAYRPAKNPRAEHYDSARRSKD